MENISFLDYTLSQTPHLRHEPFVMLLLADYCHVAVAHTIGAITLEQYIDRCLDITRSLRSRQLGQSLFDEYTKGTIQ